MCPAMCCGISRKFDVVLAFAACCVVSFAAGCVPCLFVLMLLGVLYLRVHREDESATKHMPSD